MSVSTLTRHDTPTTARRAPGLPTVTYQTGDHVTDTFDTPSGERRRYIGTVTDTTAWVFSVRWHGGHGLARYSHAKEPASLRHATIEDERAAMAATERGAVADELRRISRTQTAWPTEIRRGLAVRANEIAGSTP